ncbi:hypothetical protein BI036_gp073 [Morganella phage vB_MmoM_MP1]|uniref:Uncharacterized protein n=1 Tax=Morganella phage vB_MmoM_MP1 TaxID=1852628 RepID=A0A192Y9S9_9CAUD|nr:hypothetical protein BI036_gp073 [Morganella phage vB_MmoM_MP1]ANM46489.1 hypothetical protein MP1_gp0073 [Morganella phage vB_MmoM_MP1]
MFGYMKKVKKEVKTPIKVGDYISVVIDKKSTMAIGKIAFISDGGHNHNTTFFIDLPTGRAVLSYNKTEHMFDSVHIYFPGGLSFFNWTEYSISVFTGDVQVKSLEYTKIKDAMELQPVKVGDVLTNFKGEEWVITFIPNDNVLVIERDGQVRLLNAADKSQVSSFQGLTNA